MYLEEGSHDEPGSKKSLGPDACYCNTLMRNTFEEYASHDQRAVDEALIHKQPNTSNNIALEIKLLTHKPLGAKRYLSRNTYKAWSNQYDPFTGAQLNNN